MLRGRVSKLEFYSLGVVAANKPLSSVFIEVTPVEEFPMLDGEITDHKEPYDASFINGEGEPWSVKTITTASIKAKWVPINCPNRRTAPDVRRGEVVMIYRFSDRDEYWWNTLINDFNRIRRLETVIWSFDDLRPENITNDQDTTYWAMVSTHKKVVQVHTSKSDGEPYAYDIQINAKDGRIIITDDVGNYFELNSKLSKLELQNADGTTVSLDKGNLNIKADNINIVGNVATTGNINATGTITDTGGNTNHHTH